MGPWRFFALVVFLIGIGVLSLGIQLEMKIRALGFWEHLFGKEKIEHYERFSAEFMIGGPLMCFGAIVLWHIARPRYRKDGG